MARTLHNIDRKSGKNQKSRQSIYTLVEKVRQIYASGSLPSEREAFLHLLSYYKESGHLNEGLAFWKWLSAKEAKLDPVCAGAAIELLAVYGAGIRYCEDVYERTLLQQEGIGSQYHMSPGNILPDRSKAITVRGTSSALLQGILSARLFYGKWRRSYLTLDTAFMLRPTQIVPRFLNLFVYERPIFEALPLFLMYCRGGNTVSMATLAAILKSLQSLVHHAGQYPVRVQVVQAMLRVLETYTGSGGRLKTHHLDILASALLNAMPPVSVPATPVQPIEGDEDTATTVQNSLAKLFKYFTRHNAPPNYVTFSEIISNSVRLGYPDLAKTAFQSMRFLDISPSVVHAAEVIRAVSTAFVIRLR